MNSKALQKAGIVYHSHKWNSNNKMTKTLAKYKYPFNKYLWSFYHVLGTVPHARGNYKGKCGTILIFEEVFSPMDEKRENDITIRIGK